MGDGLIQQTVDRQYYLYEQYILLQEKKKKVELLQRKSLNDSYSFCLGKNMFQNPCSRIKKSFPVSFSVKSPLSAQGFPHHTCAR